MSFGPYCYFNNGMSMKAVDPSYVPQSGEVVYATIPTNDQLTTDFPGFAAALAAATAASNALAAIAAGVEITSSGTPTLNGTYSVDADSTADINAVITYILVNGNFPGNSSTMKWADVDGDFHTFNDVATFKAFASAIANYVAQVTIYGAGGGGSLPSNQIAIM